MDKNLDKSANENHYAENMLKGRMAETLVDEMLKRSDNLVYRFGYEAVLQNLTQIERHFDRDSEMGQRLRAIPDFVVMDENGAPTFVEVKFRRDPLDSLHEETIEVLERVEKYWNALIVFVNSAEKPYFRICKPPYFKNFSQPKRGLVFEPLTSMAAWNISADVYDEYEALVEKYLKPTSKHNKDEEEK
jgi:RNAse (barnase) inhibitor barstar